MTGYEPADGAPVQGRGTPAWPFGKGPDADGPDVMATRSSGPRASDGAVSLGGFRFAGEGTGGDEVHEPRRSLRVARNLTLAVLLAVLLVLAVLFGPTGWQILRERGAALATPPQVAGLSVDDSTNAQETVDYLRTALAAQAPLRSTVGAVYTDEEGEPRSVIFVGGTGTLWAPDKNLDATFTLVSDDSGGVDGLHAVPAGPLGGVMKCGVTRTDDGTMAVCGWADHGCLGVAMFPNRGVDESARLLLAMRNGMQRRG